MQLREFVAEALTQIFNGISDAKQIASKHGFQVNPWIVLGKSDSAELLIDRETKTPIQVIEFDIAVTTTETEQSKGGAGIFVAPLRIGGQVQSDATNSVVSRVRFSVPVALPRASQVPAGNASEVK